MTKHIDAIRFLQEVFPDYAAHAIFAHSTVPKGMAHTRGIDSLDPGRDCYWSIAAFPIGAPDRTNARALEVRCLVIDDVDTKVPGGAVLLALGPPTASVETSLGNFQWTYRLSTPVPVDQWRGFFAEIETLVGTPLEGKDAVHLFRLPMGVNTKPGRNGFACRLVELNPGVVINTPNKNYAPLSGPGPRGKVPGLPHGQLQGLMALIPNTLDRHGWIEVGHGLKALCENDDEGLAVFDAWSQTHVSYDAGKTRTAWDSFGAGGLLTKGGKLRALAEGLDADGFRKWDADAVFDDGAAHPVINTLGAGEANVTFREGEKGILLTMENAAIGLVGLGVVCRYDQFHHRVHVRWGGEDRRLSDDLVLLLRVEMNTRYGRDFGPVHTGDAIKALALKNGFNPVCEMLAAAEAGWDGVRRLDRLGPDYFHTEDSALARACFRKTMLAAVRRARRPGCKFDQILVVESPEGWDKSSAWAVLAGDGNFSDADILGKDARAVQEELADVWIHEIADLSGLSRTDIEHVKAFASRTNDRARGAYERYLKDQPRQSIEVGTTNADAYLLSTTGNRRFWPFKLTARVDMARLRADRAQLWGEAAAAEAAGETLVLDAALWADAADAQEERRVVDPWEDELANLPDTLFKDVNLFGVVWQTITNVAINDHLGGHRGAAMNSGSGRKIAEIMRRLGWERSNNIKDALGVAVRGYKKKTDHLSSVPSSVSKNPF